MPSFYCPELTCSLQQIELSGDQFHHLAHVMRHKSGDLIKLNSGKGYIGTGIIQQVDKHKAVIDIAELNFTKPSQPAYAIAFSLRSKNDEWLVEKTTELGVTDLFPITTQYSVRNPSVNTLLRFRQSALSAIKQCDNPWLPVIHPVHSLKSVIDAIRQADYEPVAAVESRPDLWMSDLNLSDNYCFIVGPEGGFDKEELDFLSESRIRSISISGKVLRAETAAIALAAQHNLIHRN